MPAQIIDQSIGTFLNQVLFESSFAFEAEGEISGHALAIFESRFRFEASGLIDIAELAEFAGAFEFVANGFLNAEPNITDEAIFESSFGLVTDGEVNSQALAVFQSSLRFEAVPHHVPAREYRVSVNLHILPTAAAAGIIRVWQPRLLVDQVEVPIISWSSPDGEDSVGEKLTVVLQRWTDKDLFTPSAVINFGIGKKVAGVWDESSFITIVEDGRFQVSSHSVNGEPATAEDRVTITLSGNLTTRLNKRPESSLVMYDGQRIEQQPSFYINQYDQLGNVYTTELDDLSGMSLRSLLNRILIQECGFDDITTNLPDYPLLQAYFPLGERLWDGLKRFLGVFSPIIYQSGTTIGIMDPTLLKPEGFPDPPVLQVDRVTSLDVSDDRSSRAVNAVRIRFIHNVEDYDQAVLEADEPIIEPDGDNTVTITRTWRRFYKSSEPLVELRSQLVTELRETHNADGVLIASSEENYTYTGDNRQNTRSQEIKGLFPDLDQWRLDLQATEDAARLANPGITDEELEALLDAVEPPYLFGPVTEEHEDFSHAAYPIDSLDGSEQKYFVRARNVQRRGLILVNSADKHLGKPFRQEFQPGARSGNITRDTTAEYGLIKSYVEIGEPVTGGLVNYTTMVTDYLPPREQVITNYSQQRPGDIGSKQFRTSERVLIIRPDGGGPIEGIEDFHFGELPLEISIPLAKRFVNYSLRSPRTIAAEYVGYGKELAPGAVRRLALRDGTVIGTFMILSRTAFGDSGGTFTRLTCREV